MGEKRKPRLLLNYPNWGAWVPVQILCVYWYFGIRPFWQLPCSIPIHVYWLTAFDFHVRDSTWAQHIKDPPGRWKSIKNLARVRLYPNHSEPTSKIVFITTRTLRGRTETGISKICFIRRKIQFKLFLLCVWYYRSVPYGIGWVSLISTQFSL